MKLAKLSDEKLKYFKRKARGSGQYAHFYAHMLMCYETMFEAACDPNASTIEWKPEIKAAMEAAGLET